MNGWMDDLLLITKKSIIRFSFRPFPKTIANLTILIFPLVVSVRHLYGQEFLPMHQTDTMHHQMQEETTTTATTKY